MLHVQGEKQMQTIKVSFIKNPTVNDPLYTYKTADEVKPTQVVKVETPEGLKNALVVLVDLKYDKISEKRFGGLKQAWLPENAPEEEVKEGVKRL